MCFVEYTLGYYPTITMTSYVFYFDTVMVMEQFLGIFIFLDTKIILIDCRNENEFSQTHVKKAILLNNNPLMVKRFLKGTKQLSDLLLVSENANSIVNKMEKILTIFYDSGNVQGSMRDVLQHLLVKKNLNVKAMEGDLELLILYP